MVYPQFTWLESYRVDCLHCGKMVSRRHIIGLQDCRFLEPVFWFQNIAALRLDAYGVTGQFWI